MRNNMRLSDDDGAQLRLIRLSGCSRLLSIAQGFQYRYESSTSHVPNGQFDNVEELYVGIVRRMVLDQDYWLLSPNLRDCTPEWNKRSLSKLHANEQYRLPTGKLEFEYSQLN